MTPLRIYNFSSNLNICTSREVSIFPAGIFVHTPSSSFNSHRNPPQAAQRTSLPATKPDQMPRTTVSVSSLAAEYVSSKYQEFVSALTVSG